MEFRALNLGGLSAVFFLGSGLWWWREPNGNAGQTVAGAICGVAVLGAVEAQTLTLTRSRTRTLSLIGGGHPRYPMGLVGESDGHEAARVGVAGLHIGVWNADGGALGDQGTWP